MVGKYVGNSGEAVHDTDRKGVGWNEAVVDIDNAARHACADVVADMCVCVKVAYRPA